MCQRFFKNNWHYFATFFGLKLMLFSCLKTMPSGIHTAKRIKHSKRRAIINALGNEESAVRIAKEFHTSERIVQIIASEEWKAVSERKKILADQADHNALLAGDLIGKQLKSGKHIPLNLLVPVYGVSVDKSASLRADPTIMVQHQHQHIHAHINEMTYDELMNSLPPDNDQQPLPLPSPQNPVSTDSLPNQTPQDAL